MPLIPALGRRRQTDLCEFETNLAYRASSRTVRDKQRLQYKEKFYVKKTNKNKNT